MKTTIKIKPQRLEGDGSSIWGDSRGTYTVNSVTVDYVNWTIPDALAANEPIHASVTLKGPKTRDYHYTDKAIPKAVSNNPVIMAAVKRLVQGYLDKAGVKFTIPDGIYVTWSEWGMQTKKTWNFDLCPLTKGKT